ncbi:MAG TPA: flavoprotein [Leptospiraceae bacterium]|nr:flavoprotein [Leptospiraceae bacterium]HMY65134.1 flavoprotein [Leptospiraceae bacterium]HMZ62235.1 flavoprotein [Leptospiraceae bacterium]HNF15012.1 flavoprotein [Leptospiraceae bacterium]HNF25860.1 flavoprotein [Leptospiraceae bacterium]
MELNEKQILIGVTGSIAAYKACELVRNLKKEGFPVRVVMTENALNFVGRTTFEALTDLPVYSSEYGGGMPHIELKNTAAVFAIVPATANIIGKMANGIADDLLSSLYLAAVCPVIAAPAMNPGMYSHPAVQRNIQQIRKDGVEVIEPDDGTVVCGDTGKGKLAEIPIIQKRIIEVFNNQSYIK